MEGSLVRSDELILPSVKGEGDLFDYELVDIYYLRG